MPESDYFAEESWSKSPFFDHYRSLNKNVTPDKTEEYERQKDNLRQAFQNWLSGELERWRDDCQADVENQIAAAFRDETFILATPEGISDIPSSDIMDGFNSYAESFLDKACQNAKIVIDALDVPAPPANQTSSENGYLKSTGFKSMPELRQGLNKLNEDLSRRKKAMLAKTLQKENTQIIETGKNIGWFQTALAMFLEKARNGSAEGAMYDTILIDGCAIIDGGMECPWRSKKQMYPGTNPQRQAKEITSVGNEIWNKTGKGKTALSRWARTSGTSRGGSRDPYVRTNYRMARGASVGGLLAILEEAFNAMIQAEYEDQRFLFWGSDARELRGVVNKEKEGK